MISYKDHCATKNKFTESAGQLLRLAYISMARDKRLVMVIARRSCAKLIAWLPLGGEGEGEVCTLTGEGLGDSAGAVDELTG